MDIISVIIVSLVIIVAIWLRYVYPPCAEIYRESRFLRRHRREMTALNPLRGLERHDWDDPRHINSTIPFREWQAYRKVMWQERKIVICEWTLCRNKSVEGGIDLGKSRRARCWEHFLWTE